MGLRHFGVANDLSEIPKMHYENKLDTNDYGYKKCLEDKLAIGLSENKDTIYGTLDCLKRNSLPTKVEIDFVNEAIWDTVANNIIIGRLSISLADAFGISAHFKEFQLGNNDYLFVYDSFKNDLKGAYMNFNRQKKSGGFYHSPVKGNTLTIKVNSTFEDFEKLNLIIDEVDAYYKHYFEEEEFLTKTRPRLWCNNNVNCPEWDFMCNEIRATVQINFRNAGNCSGALINNSCYDFEPYILTAHHCFKGDEDEIDWESSLVRFNFQNPGCDDEDMGNMDMTAAGLEVIAASGYTSLSGGSHDLAILKMTNPPPAQYNVYYAGWNIENNKSNLPKNENDVPVVVGIHHPRTTEKSISLGKIVSRVTNPIDWATPAIWTVEWLNGTAQAGSSGSPLFDMDRRVIGALSGGVNLCPIIVDVLPVLSDSWYGKLGKWNTGIDILRPCNQHLRAISGADPNRYCLPLIHVYGETYAPSIWRAAKEQILVQADTIRFSDFAQTNVLNGSNYIFQAENRVEIISANNHITRIEDGAFVRLTNAPCIYTEEQCGFNYFAKKGEKEETETEPTPPILHANYKLYPNPTQGKLRFDLTTDFEASVSVAMYDLSGREVRKFALNENWQKGKHQKEYDISNLSNGVYLFKFCINENCFNEKVVKAE